VWLTRRAEPLLEGPVEVDHSSAGRDTLVDVARRIGGADGGVIAGASDPGAVQCNDCTAIVARKVRSPRKIPSFG
jgi:hypothetical protein